MFTIQQNTTNKIQIFTEVNYDYLLIVFNYLNKQVVGLFENQSTNCPYYLIDIVEVGEDGTVSNVDGEIKLSPQGTWTGSVYAQDSPINLFPNNADEFIGDFKFQVKGVNTNTYPVISPSIDCDPAIIENSDTTFQEQVLSGDTFVLEDYEFELQDPDGVVLDNTIVPAQKAEEILVGANGFCPTSFEYNLNVNGTFQQTVTIDTFSDINITIT